MRKAYREDLSLLMVALTKFAAAAKANPGHYRFAEGWDLATGYDNLADCINKQHRDEPVYRIGDYLVFCNLVVPWYSRSPILQEWFTIKVANDNPEIRTSDIPNYLLATAESIGCVGVMGGDSSPTSIMAGAYEQANFTPLTKAYYKGTTWDSSEKA